MSSRYFAAAAALLLFALPSAQASYVIDLTTAGTTYNSATGGGPAPAIGTSFIVQQINPQSTGTGVINPFVRIQQGGNESGYNTSLGTPLDDKSPAGGFTRALDLSEIPVVVIGGVAYRQFLVDINEDSGSDHELLSLNQVQIFQSTIDRMDGVEAGQSTTSAPVIAFGTGAAEIFRLNNTGSFNTNLRSEIKMDYSLNAGSGSGDMFFYVLDSAFNAGADHPFVILYSEWGATKPNKDAPGQWGSSDGFEEWAVLDVNTSAVPEPTTMAMLLSGAGLMGFVSARRLRKSAGAAAA